LKPARLEQTAKTVGPAGDLVLPTNIELAARAEATSLAMIGRTAGLALNPAR